MKRNLAGLDDEFATRTTTGRTPIPLERHRLPQSHFVVMDRPLYKLATVDEIPTELTVSRQRTVSRADLLLLTDCVSEAGGKSCKNSPMETCLPKKTRPEADFNRSLEPRRLPIGGDLFG